MSHALPPLPAGYESRMERFQEATDLVSVGPDQQGRETFLHPAAAEAWLDMRRTATKEDMNLFLLSGFRSVARQMEILRAKLARGLAWEEILRQSAYPGFSEHHTGRAVDLAAPSCPELIEAFETTPEFSWLLSHARKFGFSLSYPRQNRQGLAYEPWHWCFTGSTAA